MVGGSSVFALSARAVDNEMVGNDKDGELICWEGWLGKAGCCAAAAARRAAVAVWVSFFDFGIVEKNWVSRFGFVADNLRGMSPFSFMAGRAIGEGGELVANGFIGLRGIVNEPRSLPAEELNGRASVLWLEWTGTELIIRYLKVRECWWWRCHVL